jgi:hypothetical protein
MFKDKKIETSVVYKHPTRLGVIIPDLSGFVPPGI